MVIRHVRKDNMILTAFIIGFFWIDHLHSDVEKLKKEIKLLKGEE